MFNKLKRYFDKEYWRNKMDKFMMYYYIVKAYLEGLTHILYESEFKYVVVESNDILDYFGTTLGMHILGTHYIFISPDLTDIEKDFIIYHELGHMMMGEEFNRSVTERSFILEHGADKYSSCMMYNDGYSKSDILTAADSVRKSGNQRIVDFYTMMGLKEPLINNLIDKNNEEWYKRIDKLSEFLYNELEYKPEQLLKEDY